MWPMYQAHPNHNAVFAFNRARVPWVRKLDGRVNGALAFSNNTIFVNAFDNRVRALNASTGEVLWSTDVGNVAMTTPIVALNTVVVGTGNSNVLSISPALVWGRPGGDRVVALDARTGRIRWQYQTIGEDMPSPVLVLVRGVPAVLFANGEGMVRALRLRDGAVIWEHSDDGVSTMSSAAFDEGSVFFIAGHYLYRVNPQDGTVIWQSRFGNADCSPTIDDGRIFVEGSNYDVWPNGVLHGFNDVDAIDERTGKLRWRWYSDYGYFTSAGSNEQGVAGLAVGGILYQSIPATNAFMAFQATTGKVLWTVHTSAAVKMSAVMHDGLLYFGDTAGTLYVVDAGNGNVVGKRVFPDLFTASPPIIRGDMLYVATDSVVRALPISAI